MSNCAKSEETTATRVKRLFHIALCCIAVAIASAANAETWPTRPIKLIVPTGPGAATDIMARLIAEGVSRTLGRPMFVENMPGASGILAHETAARAARDGYTLLFTNTSGMAINPISFKHLPYDPMRDFAAVALVCSLGPQMLSVNADLPVASVGDLIAYAQANRGKLSIAFDNTAGAAAFGAKLFNKQADLGLVEVPYRSAAQATQDVASGINQVMMSSIAAANAVVQAGKVRRLAVTSGKRFPGLPDLPSLHETVPGIAWMAFLPLSRRQAQHRNDRAAQSRDRSLPQRSRCRTAAPDARFVYGGGGTPESTAQVIRKEQEQWRAFAKELNVEPQ